MIRQWRKRLGGETRSSNGATTGNPYSLVPYIPTVPGVTPKVANNGVVEAAIGMTARAMSSARVNGHRASRITPQLLDTTVRGMMVTGRTVMLIEPADPPRFRFASGPPDIQGGPNPETWTYRINLAGPTASQYITAPSSNVLDFMWSVMPDQPWHSLAPIRGDTIALLARIDSILAAENSAETGYYHTVTFPHDVEVDEELMEIVGKAWYDRTYRDRSAEVRPVFLAGGATVGAAPVRKGSNPPATLVELRSQVAADVIAALGIPPRLLTGETQPDPAALRRWKTVTLEPLARMIGQELSNKLGEPITLTLDSVGAADATGLARAFKGYVEAGLSKREAARIVGLPADEITEGVTQ